MSQPTVSYIIPLYNKARYLPFLIEGLRRQEGAFAREFIFVDDGSTDDSAAVVTGLTASWPGVILLHQANAGPARATNAGLARATGDLVKPVDADDMLTPWATHRLLTALTDTNAEAAFGAMDCQGRYDPGADPAQSLAALAPSLASAEPWPQLLRQTLTSARTNPTLWLCRSAPLRQLGGCDDRLFVQDYSLELRLAKGGRVARLAEQIFLAPADNAGLSTNKAQILHDLNAALAHFLAAYPDLEPALARYAFRRATGRAWAWARRHGGEGFRSPHFWRHLGARTGLLAPSPTRLAASCAAFTATDPIRRPPSLA